MKAIFKIVLLEQSNVSAHPVRAAQALVPRINRLRFKDPGGVKGKGGYL